MNYQKNPVNRLVFASLIAAFTLVATMIRIAPTTQSYFNLGEVVVYTSAILFGPVPAAPGVAVGSALGDIILGSPVWAPFSFVIKGIEALIVAFLSLRSRSAIGDAAAIIPGAAWMIAAYCASIFYLYGPAAVPVEFTVDLAQTATGLVGGVLLVNAIRRASPALRDYRRRT